MTGAEVNEPRTGHNARSVMISQHAGVATTETSFRCGFGGVSFEVLSGSDMGAWTMGRDWADHLGAPDAPACARVTVSVAVDPTVPVTDRAIRWQWTAEHAVVSTRGVLAQVTRVAPRSYVASARAHRSELARTALLSALSSLLVSAEGGLVMHASAIVMKQRAVLFVGPSGAGKSTAARQTGAPLLARDRVALFESGGTWWCWGLPGGAPEEGPQRRAAHPAYPLGAIARVRKATGTARFAAVPSAGAVAVIRESAQWCQGAEGEQELLDRCWGIASNVPVSELHSVLEQDLANLVEHRLEMR